MVTGESARKQLHQLLIRTTAYRLPSFEEGARIFWFKMLQMPLLLRQLFEHCSGLVGCVSGVDEHHNLVTLLDHVNGFVVAYLVHMLDLEYIEACCKLLKLGILY